MNVDNDDCMSAALWMGYRRGGQSFFVKPFPVEARKGFGGGDCSDSLPDAEEVATFIRDKKERYGEMIVREQRRGEE